MSFLTVSHVSHSFGGRQILEDVSFKLEKGEHIGLVGANGEGKSTFFNLITNNLLPDDGQITWPGKIKVGYLDQMSSLENGKTIRLSMKILPPSRKCWSCTTKWQRRMKIP